MELWADVLNIPEEIFHHVLSCFLVADRFGMADDNDGFMYDEVLFRMSGTYGNIKQTGFQLWYDDGKRITKSGFSIDDDTEIVANIVHDKSGGIKIIIHVNNLDVIPPNYYGNTR